MDVTTWTILVEKMFVDWTFDKIYNGKPCRLRDSYTQTAHKVAMSLWSCDNIFGNEASSAEANLRNRLIQHDIRHDKKPLWLYACGQKETLDIWMYCQRATTLPYSDLKFRKVLDRHFWSTA